MHVEILIATMTGTAERVAQEIELTYADDETTFNLRLMDDLTAQDLVAGPTYLICTATYGQGDIPDNGQAFYDSLTATRPDLSGISFGVLGLGDATYADTFNHGGQQFEKLLNDLGASQVGERAQIDANDGELPEDTGLEWMEQWLHAAREAHA